MRNYSLACALLLAAGCEKDDPLFCDKNPGASGCPTADGSTGGDAGPDAFVMPDARACFGTGTFAVCLDSMPQNPLVVANAGTIDTSPTSTTMPACLPTQPAGWTAAGNPDACFIVASSIQINGALDVTGSRPLVLVSTSTLVVNADIDAASHRGGKNGPGTPVTSTTLCLPFAQMPENGGGGGGGAGGSFMATGGNGGTGNNNGRLGGNAAQAFTANPLALRAGCDGQVGGKGSGSASSAGRGGGAIYLVAADSITIATGTTITASGAGSAKPGKQSGGGGGGSGGMILLNAPAITATGAILMANGGGGSSGANDSGSGSTAGNANDGNDPPFGDPTMRASGGQAPSGAGKGGNGWITPDPNGEDGGPGTGSNCGGGGGGGGGGWIQANKALTGALTSPPATVL